MTSNDKLVKAGPASRRGPKARSKATIQTEAAQAVVTPKPVAPSARTSKRRVPQSSKPVARPNSKVAKVLSLLRRPGGVTLSAS
jgi:hypothetical protein